MPTVEVHYRGTMAGQLGKLFTSLPQIVAKNLTIDSVGLRVTEKEVAVFHNSPNTHFERLTHDVDVVIRLERHPERRKRRSKAKKALADDIATLVPAAATFVVEIVLADLDWTEGVGEMK